VARPEPSPQPGPAWGRVLDGAGRLPGGEHATRQRQYPTRVSSTLICVKRR
jgi:hypothetical protein